MPERVSIHYADFSGGDWGDVDPLQVSVSENKFKAQNMLVYDSGLVGPRAGFYVPTLTSWPANTGQALRGHALLTPAATPHGFIMFGDKLYRYNPDTSGAAIGITAYTANASGVNYPVTMSTDDSGNVFCSDAANGVFWHPDGGTTTNAVTLGGGTAGGKLVRWRDRMVLADFTGGSNRIYYSDANNFTSWPAANYYAIGPAGTALSALVPFGDALYIASNDGWYVLTGSLGSTVNISEALVGRLPVGQYSAAGSSAISAGMPFVERSSGCCQLFTGSTVIERPNHKVSQFTFLPSIHTGPNDEILYNSNQRFWFVDNKGIITYHDISSAVSGFSPSLFAYAQPIEQDPAVLAAAGNTAGVMWCAGTQSAGTTLGIGAWAFRLNYPGRVGQPPEAICESQTTGTYLYLAPFFHPERAQSGNRLLLIPDGAQLRVRAIIVNYVGWNINNGGNVGFRVYARALGLDGSSTGFVDSTIQTVSQAASGLANGGTEQTAVLYTGDQGWGRGFQIRFDSIVGVAFRSVEAIVDIRDRRIS